MVAVSSPEPIMAIVPFADILPNTLRERETRLKFKVERLKGTVTPDSFREWSRFKENL
jgi:hypothetical protein